VAAYPKPVPQSPSVTPKPWRWLWTPHHGWGVLQIGDTPYVVREQHFTDPDGRTCFCVSLRRNGAEADYQLCLNRDNELACDCPDATYRDRECKHVHAVRDAYSQLDRARRLADFVSGSVLPDDPTVALISEGWCRGAPEHLSADVVQIDANAAAAMKCGHCRRKGLTFQPWHRGRQYAATGECPVCRAVEQI
jgi:hypothetical protein